ncbi:host cell division inhibitor Icd-like protein [Salmonella enterica subsp. diarizonae]|uniref:host cell division inhibitor Icd-like protein n=1 Tax=Salmonella enterica TaxID=28901 RepID=UPI000B93D769|nr:host cell division inhibitor Icd-like protein [Salmonella enterica]EAA2772464.1 host cell division inhibitor Icd-like protein [Salmonella enterica subsp. diarizonae]ECZ0253011.1 host cell division inhibitor Icd-like protein [Salmonella enterica subsp. diarizonae]EDQ5531215.1 host cell division inhibitor Icd-like protein [Salmonella enterica subsp. diarizonae]EHA0597721.1 host cell division inhibitor Icd-like protein [Salmonella enterica]
MATAPTKNPLFVWRFISGQNSTYLTTTAISEREARSQLPAVRLVFAAKIRTESPMMHGWNDYDSETIWTIIGSKACPLPASFCQEVRP